MEEEGSMVNFPLPRLQLAGRPERNGALREELEHLNGGEEKRYYH